jgi:SAM-dependent methyltransferase
MNTITMNMTERVTAADRESQPRPQSQPQSVYVFDNADRQAPLRFSAIARLYDAHTARQLSAVGPREGWQCLEAGAGQGSIALWLSDRVGLAGHVTATDLDTRWLDAVRRPNLTVLRHDLASDLLPRDAFDLIHTRLVLMHVRNRNHALETLVASLRPGGWFVGEEFDAMSTLADPSVSASEVLLGTGVAMRRLMTERGVDLRYGRSLADRLLAHGFVDVHAEGLIQVWRGGSPGAEWLRANFEQLGEAMIRARYITDEEFQADLARLDDPAVTVPSPILWSVRGRKPAA